MPNAFVEFEVNRASRGSLERHRTSFPFFLQKRCNFIYPLLQHSRVWRNLHSFPARTFRLHFPLISQTKLLPVQEKIPLGALSQ